MKPILRTPVFLIVLLWMPMANHQSAATPALCSGNAVYWERWGRSLAEVNFMTWATNPVHIAAHPNGEVFALATPSATEFRDLIDFTVLRTIEASASPSYPLQIELSWSPSGDKLAVGRIFETQAAFNSYMSGVSVFDTQNGQLLQFIPARVSDFSWSPDNITLAVADFGAVFYTDVSRGITTTLHGVNDDIQSTVSTISWSPTGKWIAVGRETAFPVTALTYPDGVIHSITPGTDDTLSGAPVFAWSPDGNTLAIGNYGRFTWLWSTQTQTITAALEVNDTDVALYDAAWSPDGRWLTRGATDGVYFWDVASGDASPTIIWNERMPAFIEVEWLPNGDEVLSVDFTGSIYAWDINTACVRTALLRN